MRRCKSERCTRLPLTHPYRLLPPEYVGEKGEIVTVKLLHPGENAGTVVSQQSVQEARLRRSLHLRSHQDSNLECRPARVLVAVVVLTPETEGHLRQ